MQVLQSSLRPKPKPELAACRRCRTRKSLGRYRLFSLRDGSMEVRQPSTVSSTHHHCTLRWRLKKFKHHKCFLEDYGFVKCFWATAAGKPLLARQPALIMSFRGSNRERN